MYTNFSWTEWTEWREREKKMLEIEIFMSLLIFYVKFFGLIGFEKKEGVNKKKKKKPFKIAGGFSCNFSFLFIDFQYTPSF